MKMFLADLYNQREESRVPNTTGDRKPIEKAAEIIIQAKDCGLETRVVAGQEIFVDCLQQVKEKQSVATRRMAIPLTEKEISQFVLDM